MINILNDDYKINYMRLKKELKDHIIKNEQLINKMKQLHEANGKTDVGLQKKVYYT